MGMCLCVCVRSSVEQLLEKNGATKVPSNNTTHSNLCPTRVTSLALLLSFVGLYNNTTRMRRSGKSNKIVKSKKQQYFAHNHGNAEKKESRQPTVTTSMTYSCGHISATLFNNGITHKQFEKGESVYEKEKMGTMESATSRRSLLCVLVQALVNKIMQLP